MAYSSGACGLVDLLRAVHAQDDLVREPVAADVHDEGEAEADHQSLLAAEGLADPDQQRREHRQKDQGLHPVHVCPPRAGVPARFIEKLIRRPGAAGFSRLSR